MAKQMYSDLKKLTDGSGRWLWQVYYDEHLWRAGVVDTLELAQATAEGTSQQLVRWIRKQVGESKVFPPAEPMIDLDLVEKGPGPQVQEGTS